MWSFEHLRHTHFTEGDMRIQKENFENPQYRTIKQQWKQEREY
jgi:hypothetical protein